MHFHVIFLNVKGNEADMGDKWDFDLRRET